MVGAGLTVRDMGCLKLGSFVIISEKRSGLFDGGGRPNGKGHVE